MFRNLKPKSKRTYTPVDVGTWVRRTKTEQGHAGDDKPMRMDDTMRALATVVADNSRDIKLLRSAVTLKGAERYLKNQGKDKRGYNAYEEDIYGDPEKEVFITDPDGKVVVLNGWKLAPSMHGPRKMVASYNDGLPQYEKKISTKTIKDMIGSYYINKAGALEWNQDYPANYKTFIANMRKKKEMDPRKLFRIHVWNPMWNDAYQLDENGKKEKDENGQPIVINQGMKSLFRDKITYDNSNEVFLPPMLQARAANQAFVALYNEVILKPVVEEMGLQVKKRDEELSMGNLNVHTKEERKDLHNKLLQQVLDVVNNYTKEQIDETYNQACAIYDEKLNAIIGEYSEVTSRPPPAFGAPQGKSVFIPKGTKFSPSPIKSRKRPVIVSDGEEDIENPPSFIAETE